MALLVYHLTIAMLSALIVKRAQFDGLACAKYEIRRSKNS